ncbi:MAG: hypothetical protein IPM56_03840 [Ignavibacteriales bacterium]|nr:MAG: hypothetical protein IPM56_03840 [Ignavibacteriales bacterium]
MIWYKIIFTQTEVNKGKDKAFVKEFSLFFDRINRPQGMSLYSIKEKGDTHIYFYLCMPPHFPLNVESLFAHYRITHTFEPYDAHFEFVAGFRLEEETA